MRLILVTQDFPPDVGGTQTYAFELATWLAAHCDDFAVLAPLIPGCHTIDAQLPYDVIRVPASYNTLGLKAGPILTRLANERDFDTTFHVQWQTLVSSAYAISRSPIQHVYVAAHGRELLLQPLPLLKGLYNKYRKRLLGIADLAFPVSRYTSELLKGLGVSADRIHVIPNGVNSERFVPGASDELNVQLGINERPVILTVCRLVQRKGIDAVLRALPTVIEAVPDVLYVVGGRGPDQERLEKLSNDLGVSDHVLFAGYISDEDLPAYYNLCDVFTMPAHHHPPDVEGFGLVFLEAGASGKACIGSTAGGIPDAIDDGKTGFLISPGDATHLSEKLIYLLKNPDAAAELGTQARLRATTEATWDSRASSMLDIMKAHQQ